MAGLHEVGPVSHAKEWGPNSTGPRKPLMVFDRGAMAQICCWVDNRWAGLAWDWSPVRSWLQNFRGP